MSKAKAEADTIIQKFYKWSDGRTGTGNWVEHTIENQRASATQCAIIHVKEILKEIEFSSHYVPEHFWKLQDKHWNSILTELEKR